MALFENCVVTDAGLALMADIVNNQDTLLFTQVVVGDGTYSAAEKQPAALRARTALKSQKQAYDVSYIESVSAEQVRLRSLIANYDPDSGTALFETGFYVNEMGLMAKGSNDDDAILFMVTVTAQEQGDYLPHYEGDNPVEILQDLVAAITNDIEINVTYSESAFATAADLQEHEGKKVASNTGVHGFRYQGGRFQQIVGGVWSDLDLTPGIAYLYDLCEKTTTIGDDGHGNTQITERNDTYEVTTVTTIVQTSPTVKTITQVITPDAGDSYTKTTVITETVGGKTIEESFVINE